jgi:hypothetical protein
MLGELECRIDLAMLLASVATLHDMGRTSESSTSGGPSAMSSAFVPGRIRRAALLSRLLKNFCCSGEAGTGDNWSSGIGGGLGSRGEAGVVILEAVHDTAV